MDKPFIHTKNEIEGQPELWLETLTSILENQRINVFLKSIFDRKNVEIILTGAGSSAFIGETVEHLYKKSNRYSARAIATTTLVTHFKQYVDPEKPLLLISFARSGNSPESIAVIDIAEQECNEVYHIALTCNRAGRLAEKITSLPNGHALILPPSSEDQGLAMTGSFTSMMLSAIYLAGCENQTDHLSLLQRVSDDARSIINHFAPALKEISIKNFERIVFLGSGPLLGIARESHLKVQELTDGKVVGKFDSFLGFRHGPKAVVNEKTILVFLFSPDKKVFRYEKDLVEEIVQEGSAMSCIGVFFNRRFSQETDLDLNIITSNKDTGKHCDYDLLPYVIPAQILGFYKSLDLGLEPDTPSTNNSISRVVKGVRIYSEEV